MWLEYKPSRRSREPFEPGSLSRSYSSKMASLYSDVNRRLTGFAAGSPVSRPPPFRHARPRLRLSWSLVYVFLTRPGAMVGYCRCLTSA